MTPETTTLAAAPAGSAALPTWLDLGPVQLRPHVLYRLSYGNGIQAQPGQASKTAINEVSPGLTFDLGTHWHLDYTPTLRYYSSSHFQDSLDHAVLLNGGTAWQDWVFGLSQGYSQSSTPLVETASQTDQESFATSLNAAWQCSSKVSLDAAVSQNFRFLGQNGSTNQGFSTNGLSDSRSWSTTEGVNYQVWPKFSVGLSVGFTYDDLSVGSDMTSEQLQARINWRAGEKLTFSFTGGAEARQFLNSNEPDSLNPIFSLSILYRLFEVTTISISASRTVSPSYFQNQITESIGFTAGLQQRLLQKLYLDLSGGYSTSSYQATTSGLAVNREDDGANINVRLTYPFLRRGSASVFYDWSDNTSNQAGFAYTSNQVGLELGYRY